MKGVDWVLIIRWVEVNEEETFLEEGRIHARERKYSPDIIDLIIIQFK